MRKKASLWVLVFHPDFQP